MKHFVLPTLLFTTLYLANSAMAADLSINAVNQKKANDCITAYDNGLKTANYAQAVKHCITNNEQASSLTEYITGLMYLNGQGVIQDYNVAQKWLEKSAKRGNEQAQFLLGLNYLNGLGISPDFNKAKMWFEQAAQQNNGAAEYYLGLIYLNGQGVGKDTTKAISWFEKSVQHDYVEDLYNLGLIYMDSNNNLETEKGVKYLTQAANKQYSKAQNLLAFMYANGQGVKKDYSLALQWLKQAAEQGESYAQYHRL